MRLAVEMTVMDMDGEISAVAVGADSAKFHGMLRLNQEGADIIELLSHGSISFDEIVKSLQTKYTDSSPDEIGKFTLIFLKKLYQEGLLLE